MPQTRPTPTAVPASTVVGANIHGERVEENAAGQRRVLVGGVWRAEAELEPLRAARIHSADDARMAASSLAIHEVSAAFGHDPARAWLFFGARPGRPVDMSPAALAAIDRQSPAYKAYLQAVEKAAASRSLHLRQHGSVVPVPNWSRTIAAPGPAGYPLGLWIGLLARAKRSAHRLDPSDPSSFRIPSSRFGKTVAWPEHVVAIDPADPEMAKPWLARPIAGWWLFATPARADAAIAPSHQAQRLEIRQEGRVLGVAVHRSLEPVAAPTRQSISLAQFAGDPPTRHADRPAQEPDVFGRVPYRSMSSAAPSEAVAPLRLELAMHHALSELAQRIPDLVAHVAAQLGLDAATLDERLSPEQVDAVAMALYVLASNGAFLLADETGFGKGRTLAALALAGRRAGRPVVVVTENASLFSDFYRDILAVGGPDAPVPVPLHATARIADPNGDVVARGTAQWPAPQAGLFITTYGQLSTDKTGAKAKWMTQAMGADAWLLMDESHNAAGNAVVFEAVEALASIAAGAVFASATFARAEHNLALYRRVLDIPADQVKRMQHALADDDGLLRQVLVEQLARRGRLLRREHPAIAPPPAHWVDLNPELAHALEHFQQFWRHLFAACEAFEELSGGRTQVAWLKLGAWLSRTVREFSMLAKTPALADFIAASIAADSKVVIAADLTFEAALRDGAGLTAGKAKGKGKSKGKGRPDDANPLDDELDDQIEDDLAPGTGLLWRDRLRALLDAVVPSEQGTNAPPSSPQRQRLGAERDLALAALQQLPEWTLSPFDELSTRLAASSIPMGELSGRSVCLASSGDGELSTARRQVPDRRELVSDFNAGKLDAVLLTRAGSTGISLHAGRQFADQRQRQMIEWGIAADPLVRQQFWGRVRRRDQVCEPGYASLALDTPFERRVRAREEKKRLRLASFAGHGRAMEPDEVGPEGEALVAEWAGDRPDQARRIGVLHPLDKPGDRVDRALVRGIVLPEVEAVAMVERLDRGLSIQADLASLRRADFIEQPSRIARRQPWITGTPTFAGWGVDLVERVMRAPPQADGAAVKQALAAHRASNEGFVPGPRALELWKAIWSREPPTSPNDARRKKIFSKVSPLLAWLEPGRGIQMSDPRNGQATRALVMGVQMPPDIKPVSQGASRLAPSQVAVRLFIVGLDRPVDIPLSVLLADRQLKPEGQAQPSWFDLPASPWVLATLEGDPLAAARSGRHWGCGQLSLLLDETGRERTAWRFPVHRGFGFWSVQPRDAHDIQDVRDFLYANPDAPVLLALPLGRHAWLESSTIGVWLVSDATSEALIERDWATVAHRKTIDRPRRSPDGQVRRLIAYGNLPRLLYGWQSQGLGFRLPARFAS